MTVGKHPILLPTTSVTRTELQAMPAEDPPMCLYATPRVMFAPFDPQEQAARVVDLLIGDGRWVIC